MSYTDTLYLLLFTTGFTVGFGHCIGMCGPIVVSLSLNMKGQKTFASHLLYNAGRITTYALIGGIMGVTGSFTRVASDIAYLQKTAMIFTGLIIIIMGIAMSGWIRSLKIFENDYKPSSMISKGFRALSQPRSRLAYYPLGLLLGLLPCGAVYTSLITAARAGMETSSTMEGFFRGIGIMLAFGLGTIPALFLVAKLADLGWLTKRDIIYKVGSVLMIIVGIYFVIRGIKY
jgi:sulfite exporter TauE/SafE